MEKEKHQLENPNNARITIDYSKEIPDERVKFDYVGTSSNYKVCLEFFRGYYFAFHLYLPFVVLCFSIVYAYKFSLLDGNPISKIYVVLCLPLLILGFCLPNVIAFIFSRNKRLLKLMPRLWASQARYFFHTFKPEEVKENKVEIPLFRNVLLDYKATEEFSKYLTKVEVIEHEFDYMYKATIFSKKFRRRNEYLWKAIFYFSDTPKTGELKTRFN